ncbi:hypothetical protein NDS46_25850 [Paenibacillus thiaminolyticus]|uniref:hypothetical protein n=1 Tax=Paenibacillus thiaminolyticus TaxID=49283 RepID=UPI00232AB5F0|nr:hypothetical protein [Paenibacillus thiaminolyticus]WCF07687.1 hypothetical protein NDS46_25850 [Paenibacillus thiaminolyticus]
MPTTGFKNITVSSTQTSSGTGPRDFKAQFSLDNRTWTDIQGGVLKMETHNFNCKNNACKLINKPLPQEANNQPLLYVRWVVNSDARTSGESGGVGSAGSSRIKDVRIAGERIDGSGHTPRLVNMTFNGDPKTSIALAWYTDQMTGTVLQVVEASKNHTVQLLAASCLAGTAGEGLFFMLRSPCAIIGDNIERLQECGRGMTVWNQEKA